jgi:hypothetical protein
VRQTPFITAYSTPFTHTDSSSPPTSLATLSRKWIRDRQALLLLGSPGVGKSHLAAGLGVAAIERGLSVVFYRIEELLHDLRRDARMPPAHLKRRKYMNAALLIVDDVGFEPFSREDANLFFRLVSYRYQRGAILITSNKSIRDWPEMLAGDETIATAILFNSATSLAYVRRNWEQLKTLGLRAIYSDTITAELFKQSWEPGHTQTRTQDEALKIELLRFFKAQGLVLASECGADFGVPWLDWAPAPPSGRIPGETIPLFSLVFHDCVFRCVGFFGNGQGFDARQLRTVSLAAMLEGYFFMAGGFTAESWAKSRDAFVESFCIDAWHAQIGLDRMTRHEFLTADFLVEQTTFSSGASIIVNFGACPAETPFGRVEANGYLIIPAV